MAKTYPQAFKIEAVRLSYQTDKPLGELVANSPRHFPHRSEQLQDPSFLPRLIDSANIPGCPADNGTIGNRYQAHNLRS